MLICVINRKSSCYKRTLMFKIRVSGGGGGSSDVAHGSLVVFLTCALVNAV